MINWFIFGHGVIIYYILQVPNILLTKVKSFFFYYYVQVFAQKSIKINLICLFSFLLTKGQMKAPLFLYSTHTLPLAPFPSPNALL